MADDQGSAGAQASPENMAPNQDTPSGEVLPGLKAEELEASRVEEREDIIDIPKAAELYKGDINAAVIEVQKITGVEIDKVWWDENVQPAGASQDTESILARFDAAYAQLLASKQ